MSSPIMAFAAGVIAFGGQSYAQTPKSQFGLHCVSLSSEYHFTIDLDRQLYCSVAACEMAYGKVDATPDYLILHFEHPTAPGSSGFSGSYFVSRMNGSYTELINGSRVASGNCSSEEYSPIPPNVAAPSPMF